MTARYEDETRKGLPRWMVMTILIVVAFLVGSGIQYFRANRLAGQLEETQHALAFTRLEATLGAATIEAQRQSYESSRQLASDFFTQLQQHIEDAPPEAQGELRGLLGERDAIITMLSRFDAQSGNVLSRAFVRYRGAAGARVANPD
jgi:Tfp pilus assembly protein PilX